VNTTPLTWPARQHHPRSGWPYGGPKTTLALAAGRLKVVAIPINGAKVEKPPLAEGDSFIAAFVVAGTEKSFDPASAKPSILRRFHCR